MDRVRVQALNLRLVAPSALRPRGERLKEQAETSFVPDVLKAMGRRLGRRFGPDAVIRIRRLRLRLGLQASALDTAAAAETLGEEIARQVEAMVARERGGGLLPEASAGAQVFRNRAHFDAVTLIAAAARQPGPDGDRPDFGDRWRLLAAAKPKEIARTLALCAEAGALSSVLARLQVPELKQLMVRLDRAAPAPVAAAIAAALRQARTERGRAAPTDAIHPAPTWPEPPPAERSADARQPAPAGGTEAQRPGAASGPNETPADGVPDKQAPAVPEPQTLARAPSRTAPAHRAPAQPGETPPPEAAERAAPPAAPVAPPDSPPGPPESPMEPDALQSFPSDWCALLYLANIALKLELPERLWRIGIDEGAALAAIFARLAGTEADAATRVLSQAFPETAPEPGPLPDWARDELVSETLAELESRFGSDGIAARIVMLEAWFGKGGWSLPAWGAAVHLAVAERMLGTPIEPGTVAERFARPGRIAVTPDRISVIQPLDAIDIDIRKAGLDANPGWLPWLGKRLDFVFGEPAEPETW